MEDPISWADEERDLTAWLGNELQSEAYKKVYAMTEKLAIASNQAPLRGKISLYFSSHPLPKKSGLQV